MAVALPLQPVLRLDYGHAASSGIVFRCEKSWDCGCVRVFAGAWGQGVHHREQAAEHGALDGKSFFSNANKHPG